MVLPVLPIPPFPSVPVLPGVPLLARASGVRAQVSRVVLYAADAVNLIKAFLPSTWGLYSEKGAPLLLGDNVMAVDYKSDARLADYPIERGGFASYNKVETPYDIRATFTIGGNPGKRAAFLAILDKLTKGLEIVTLVTADQIYKSANVIHYDYRRTSKGGVTLLTVEVWLMEVRLTAGATFTQGEAAGTAPPVTAPATPAGASPASAGAVQAAAPTAVQAQALPAIAPSPNVPLAPGIG